MASALASTCDVAVYEQGVWFLRLSAVLLLASFANYATLPSKDKAAKPAAVAQVEEIKEAVAMPAPQPPSSIRQGVDIQVPPLPGIQTPHMNVRSGKVIESGMRVEDTRKLTLQPFRRGVVRKRKRAASQEKFRATHAGSSTELTNLPNVPLNLRQSRTMATANIIAEKTPRGTSSKQKPLTISMSPSKIEHLQLSL